ncbi:GtrA family protein [Bradyrhizobium algeriense]|uniref:GtrA family protein n=1 Tax=Bradyrhizobium algeriense TaxID=634784 RepID=UPI0011AEA084|nr:GtrA family protein [Bradyrhizobium algeriense]
MPQSVVRPATWRGDAMLGLAGALLAFCLHALAGFPTLAGNGDNDSLLRLVEIRDLIGGQGWFDLHQYRMGPAGGFVMHWSRLVDATIATIILAVTALTGKLATGETFALFAWTTPLMAAALAFLLRIARTVGNDWAVMPAFIICAAALHFSGVFAPGDIDHHNVQLTLCLAAITALIVGRSYSAGIAAGAACALMLAVGMETLPYVAVAGLTASAAYLLGEREEAAKAAGFGLGLAGVGLAAFVATVPASGWLSPHCDAYSIPQFAVAAISGLGLAATAASPALGRSFGGRLGALLALGIAVAVIAVTVFPQCLADPYAALNPRLQQFWLNQVTEAQSFWRVLSDDWVKAAGIYVTPILALVVLGLRLRRRSNAAGWILMAFLTATFAVSLWQVRGATFSLPLAAVALAAWVGDWRHRTALTSDRTSMLRMALVWLISLNVTWSAAAHAASAALTETGSAATPAGTCERPADYALLAAQPPTTVLAISNLGSPILAHTPHRVLAGPYHRNVIGNLLALDAFMGTAEQARPTIENNRIGLVAICRGNAETALLTAPAPAGLLAALTRSEPPDWLEKLPQATGEPLEIYRVRPRS